MGALVAVGVAAPRLAGATTELSLHAPVTAAIGAETHFELGLRSDLLYQLDPSALRLGVAGEVRSVSLSQRAQEVGGAVAWLEDVGGNVFMGPMLDAGYGSMGGRRYLYGRASYQLRARIQDPSRTVAYAISTGIVLGLRRDLGGSDGFETVIGVELGGGLIATMMFVVRSIVQSG